METQKLVYVANARLPTEKAHGYQICKMCEAFVLNGVDVLLMYPYRHQFTPELCDNSVFNYYGIPPVFKVCRLPNWDVVRLDPFIPDRWFTPVFFTHAMLWGLYAALKVRHEQADLFYYTRDSQIAYWLVRLGLATVYEAHVVPKRGQRWLLKRIAHHRNLRLVVVLTSFIKQRFVEMGFPTEKVIVLPDAVDVSLFENLPSKEKCRQRLDLPIDRHIIGYIGRFKTLEMEKGVPELVQVMSHLPSINGKEPLLLCVGGPIESVPAYVDLGNRLGVPEGRLKFVGRVPNQEVPYWIRACDLVTIPWPWTEFSAYFTSPLKLFEYMAAGVPIVASDLPSIREVLRHGENAWLVEPGNAGALTQALCWLLEKPERGGKLAIQASRQVRNHTWVERTDKILRTLGVQ
jgi:glycosyltransferase involved in cell wall biosynthesis